MTTTTQNISDLELQAFALARSGHFEASRMLTQKIQALKHAQPVPAETDLGASWLKRRKKKAKVATKKPALSPMQKAQKALLTAEKHLSGEKFNDAQVAAGFRDLKAASASMLRLSKNRKATVAALQERFVVLMQKPHIFTGLASSAFAAQRNQHLAWLRAQGAPQRAAIATSAARVPKFQTSMPGPTPVVVTPGLQPPGTTEMPSAALLTSEDAEMPASLPGESSELEVSDEDETSTDVTEVEAAEPPSLFARPAFWLGLAALAGVGYVWMRRKNADRVPSPPSEGAV